MSSVEPVRVTSPIAMRATRAESASESLTIKGRRSRNRWFADSLLEGDGFELPVREHRDSRMRTHLVVNHRVAVHVPVLIYRLRPGGANNSKLGLLLGQASPTGRCYDLGLLITGTGSKLRWPSSFRAAAELRRDGVRRDGG